ncbi:hypothetical protein [Bradyrhizobium sp. USDA 4369]
MIPAAIISGDERRLSLLCVITSKGPLHSLQVESENAMYCSVPAVASEHLAFVQQPRLIALLMV